MNTSESRRTRTKADRRVFAVGLAVSVALHGWAFASLTIDPPDLTRAVGVPERAPAPSPAMLSAIEVVRMVEVEEEVVPLPLPQDTRPVLAAASSERSSDPNAHTAEVGSRSAATGGESGGTPGGAPADAAPEAASEAAVVVDDSPAVSYAERMEAAMGNRPAVTMQAQFVAQHPMEPWQPIEAVPTVVDTHAGHDHAEVEENSSMWGTVWRRVGRTFGFGGNRLCRPIPPVAGKATEGR